MSENVWVDTNNVVTGRLELGVVAPFDWVALPWLSAGILATGRFSHYENTAGVGESFAAGVDIPFSSWGARLAFRYLPSTDLNFIALNGGVFRRF